MEAVGLFINNVIYCIIQLILLISIFRITFRSYIEYRLLQKESNEKRFCNTLLFIFGLLFNIAGLFCIFSLFCKTFVQLNTFANENLRGLIAFSQIPLLFPCNLVFLQNTFLMIVLFIRIYFIFHGSPFQVAIRTIVLFTISLLISSGIFMVLLTTKIRIPGTDSWVNCAVTLCIFNMIFAIWITSLFLKKLTMTLKHAYTAANINNKRRVRKEDMAFIKTITKTALLSFISMFVTFISCLLLLFRYSLFGESMVVNVISEWVVCINIYCNFACYSLAFRYYDKYYDKLCKKMDKECRSMWLFVMLGDEHSNEHILKSILEPSMISSTRTSANSSKKSEMISCDGAKGTGTGTGTNDDTPISGVSTGDIIIYDDADIIIDNTNQTPEPVTKTQVAVVDPPVLEEENSNNSRSSTGMDLDQVLDGIDIGDIEMDTV